ncbi:MAG: carboxypeptidase-like regulatory domain-containing protein [Desulfobacteraceae bacterium]|nr:carboxypeptidase-like regulatory domain-containing protein [Desulfobacteraceae bacterium]
MGRKTLLLEVLRKWYLWPVLLLWVSVAWCHGVDGAITPANGYMVTVRYDDGEPMSYAEVKIQAPDNNLAFQTGRTDRNGRWMFQPDRPGRWEVEVKDGMGHRTKLTVAVSEENLETASVAPTATAPPHSRGFATVTGLAVLFGLAGWSYGWRVRRRSARIAKATDRSNFSETT